MSRDINPFGLRMPDPLRDALQNAAAASGRSLNSEIIVRLSESLGVNLSGSEDDVSVQTNIRIPSETRLRIKDLADANKRTFTAQVVFMLEAFLADIDAEAGGTSDGQPLDTRVLASEVRGRMTVAAAADYLGLSASALNQFRCAGKGPRYLKIGNRVFYRREDLDTYENSRLIETSSS